MLFPFTAHATLVNTSFESGLTGWSSIGAAGTLGAAGPHAPTDGASMAALQTQGVFTGEQQMLYTDESIAAELGLPDQLIIFEGMPIVVPYFESVREDFVGDPDMNGPYGECTTDDDCFVGGGAAIYQQFQAEAGDRVTFNFNFLRGEIFDYAFAVLISPSSITALTLAESSGQPIGLAPVNPAFADTPQLCTLGLSPNCFMPNTDDDLDRGATGWTPGEITVDTSGLSTIAFVLLNESFDGIGETGLLLDGVQLVKAVNEPSLLFLLGLAGLVLARRRRRG